MLNQDDLKLIEAKGITESTIDAQLKRFAVGFPALKIEAAQFISWATNSSRRPSTRSMR